MAHRGAEESLEQSAIPLWSSTGPASGSHWTHRGPDPGDVPMEKKGEDPARVQILAQEQPSSAGSTSGVLMLMPLPFLCLHVDG